MKKFPKVFIVVLNYNGKDVIQKTLSDVFRLDYPNFEIILVDNNSTDGSFETVKKSFSKIKIFLEQLKSPLIYILFLAGIITLVLEEYSDSIIIFAAVFLNTIIGYLQEEKANNALDKLKKILQSSAVVFRNGQEKNISQKEIVPGDIILLRAGDKIPADARIVESHDLKINESSLTGEMVGF